MKKHYKVLILFLAIIAIIILFVETAFLIKYYQTEGYGAVADQERSEVKVSTVSTSASATQEQDAVQMNNKITTPIVCFYYTPSPVMHDALSGGERVILKFIQLLNDRGIQSALFSKNAQKSDIVPFTNAISDKTVVMYSEGVYGNPLNAKKICRWMLYDPFKRGGQKLIDSWSKTDVLCSYGNYGGGMKCDISVNVVDFNEDKFVIQNKHKPKKYFLIHKALLSGWDQETLNSEIMNLKQSGFEEFKITQTEKMNDMMQDCCVFVSFDLNTYVSNIAVLCGALSMIKKSETVNSSYADILEKRGSYGSIGIKPFNNELLNKPYNYSERLNESNLYHEYTKSINNIDEFINRFSLYSH